LTFTTYPWKTGSWHIHALGPGLPLSVPVAFSHLGRVWSWLDPRPVPSALQLPTPEQGLEVPFFLSNHLHGPVWDHCLLVPRLLRTPEWEGLPPGSPPPEL